MGKMTRAGSVALCGFLLASASVSVSADTPRVKHDVGYIEIPQGRNFNLEILVDGSALPKISHHGKLYVEAPQDSDFALRLTCPNNGRYMAVCSVDGLSIMTGKDASSNDPGYLVENGSLTIPGYRLDKEHVAHFHFGQRHDSYAARMGKPKNIGVIAAKVFTEKHAVRPWPIDDVVPPRLLPPITQLDSYRRPGVYKDSIYGDEGTNLQPRMASGKLQQQCIDDRLQSRDYKHPAPARATTWYTPVEHDMGSEFGRKTDFETRDVAFQRGAEIATIAIDYASREKLIAAGIIARSATATEPNPFPADTYACTPPAGWSQ